MSQADQTELDRLIARLDDADRVTAGPCIRAEPWPPGDTTVSARISGTAYGTAADEMAWRITEEVPDWDIVRRDGSWIAVAEHRMAAIRLCPGKLGRDGIEVTGYRFHIGCFATPSVITTTCLASHAGREDLFRVIDILRSARVLPEPDSSDLIGAL